MTKKEVLPIILQDGTKVKVGSKIYRIFERNMYSPRYSSRKRDKQSFPEWSGEVAHVYYEDLVIRIQEGFNSRTFVLRDSKGVERFFSVKAGSRHDCTRLLFGLKKSAIEYIKENNRKDVEHIGRKICEYTERLAKFKECEKKLRLNLRSLK